MKSDRLSRLVHLRELVRDQKREEARSAEEALQQARELSGRAKERAERALSDLSSSTELSVADLELQLACVNESSAEWDLAEEHARMKQLESDSAAERRSGAEIDSKTIELLHDQARSSEGRESARREQNAADERSTQSWGRK